MKNIVIEGKEMSERNTYFIVRELLKAKLIEKPEEAQEYMKYHKVEEWGNEIILRNPHYNGMHFKLER